MHDDEDGLGAAQCFGGIGRDALQRPVAGNASYAADDMFFFERGELGGVFGRFVEGDGVSGADQDGCHAEAGGAGAADGDVHGHNTSEVLFFHCTMRFVKRKTTFEQNEVQ
ncbi:MAG: hypothetical protein IJM07_06990 [Pyramidobacter sp.]|nr:hypothetical protein [Pyramidobacter sp.]